MSGENEDTTVIPENEDAIADSLFDNKTVPDADEDAEETSEKDDTQDSDESEDSIEESESDDTEDSEEEEDESEESEEEEDPEDYEEPIKPKKDAKKKGEEVDPEPANESEARKRAKENGRKLKAAEAQLIERDNTISQKDARIQELEKENREIRKIGSKPMDDPEYAALHNQILTDVGESAELVDDVRNVPKHFPKLVTKYLATRNSENRDADIAALKREIIDNCYVNEAGVSYDEMDDTEKKSADKAATKVLKIIRDSVPNVQKAIELADKIENDAKEGSFLAREREYTRATAEMKDFVEGFGQLADDVIEANPHALASFVAATIKDSPGAAKRATRLKQDILEVFSGLRPLTRAEVTKMEKEGKDVAAFEKERVKLHKAKRQKMAAYLFEGVMVRSAFPELLKKTLEKAGEDADEKDEIALAFNRTRKTPGKKKAKPSSKSVVEKTAREQLLGAGFDDDD